MVELLIGEMLIVFILYEINYEGELNELEIEVIIFLFLNIINDSCWIIFFDIGFVEVCW